MASLQKHRSGGRTYWRIVESRRVKGKPRPIPVAWLGTADQLLERLRSGGPGPLRVRSYLHGSVAALKAMADRLGLVELIDRHVPSGRRRPSVGTTLVLAALNRAVRPRSKMGWADWAGETSVPHLFGLPAPKKLTSQFFWDQMDRVPEEALEAMEEELVQKVVTEFRLRLDVLLYDTTNFFTYIASENRRPQLPQRGHSKQKRTDLRQISTSVVCTRDGRIPLGTRVYEGNIPDSVEFPRSFTRLRRRLETLLGQGVEGVTLVYDMGNNSRANQAQVDGAPLHYVAALPPSAYPALVAIPMSDYTPLDSGPLAGLPVYRCRRQVWGEERTLVLYRSEQLRAGQIRGLNQHLAKKIRALEEWKAQLGEPRSGPRTPESARKKVASLCAGQYVREVLRVVFDPEKNGAERLTWWIDGEARRRLEEEVFGKRILMTDQHGWPAEEIILAYRGQYELEGMFRQQKDPFHLAVRPQFHWTDQKIRVHIFLCLLGYMLARLVYHEARARCNWSGNLSGLLDLLGKVRLTMVLSSSGKRGGRPRCRWVIEEGDPAAWETLLHLVPQEAPFVYTRAVE